MNIILCLDDKNGMMFNHRRQSRDRAVAADIISMLGEIRLWIRPYSETLFCDYMLNYHVSENPYKYAGEEDFCFIEDEVPNMIAKKVKSFVIYRWNRVYPSDIRFDLDLAQEGFTLTSTEEFVGTSHEKITKEVWRNERDD